MSKRSNFRHIARRTTRARQATPRSLYRRPLRFEPLEDRRLLAVVTVDTIDDTIDFGDGLLSLREAIFATNTVPGPDTIEFDASLTAGGSATILLTQGELAITDSLTINGPGAEWLTEFWAGGRSRAWVLAQTALLHPYGHYFEARVAAGLLGARSP